MGRVAWARAWGWGSLAAITDESGEPIARHTFAPFGRPLAADGTDTGGRLHAGEVATTPRGFTGHEHLDAHRLIHMGGRVFDPDLGRFLSVDPFIQNLASSQSLNPYSYVLNSPFAATDPTGFARACLPKGGEGVPACGGLEEPPPIAPAAPAPGSNGQEGQPSRNQAPRPPVENLGPTSRDDGTGGQSRSALPAGGSLRLLATGEPLGTDADRRGVPHRASAPEPLSMLPLGLSSSETHASPAAAGVIVRVMIKIASKGRQGIRRVFRRGPASRPGSTAVDARGTGRLPDDALEHLSPQIRKSVRSWETRLAEHRAKLDAYRRNPDAFDNEGFLKNAPTQEIRQRIIDTRIRHIDTEIRNFEKQIADALKGG